MKARLSIEEASYIMEADRQFIRIALQRGSLPIGIAEKKPGAKQFAYYISTKLVSDYIGITPDEINNKLNERMTK